MLPKRLTLLLPTFACEGRQLQIGERDPPHSGNQLLHLLPFFRALSARTFRQGSSFFPQTISLVNNWQQTDKTTIPKCYIVYRAARQLYYFCFLKCIQFVLHWPKCGSIKFSILCLLLLLVLVRIDFMSKFIPGEWKAHRRGMDISEGHKAAGRGPMTCVNGAKTRGEKAL